MCERFGPGGAIAVEGGDDFTLVSRGSQSMRNVARSAAIVRALVTKPEAKLPSACTRHDEIRIRREAGHIPAASQRDAPSRAVPKTPAIAVHRKRSCAVPHKNIGERSAVAIPLVVDDRRDPRNPGLNEAPSPAAAIPESPRE